MKAVDELDGEEKKGRTDLLIRTPDEPFPIIIELKRNSRPVKYTELYEQIKKYRTIIRANCKDTNAPKLTEIKAFLIVSEKTGTIADVERLGIDETEMHKLRLDNIELMTYGDIVVRIEDEYREYYDQLEKQNGLPLFFPKTERNNNALPGA